MARVICNLQFVTSPINGHVFTEDRGQWLSDEMSDEDAADFVLIPGYALVEPPPPAVVPATKKKGAPADVEVPAPASAEPTA